MATKLERIYTVPLKKAYGTLRKNRARKAVKLLRSFAAKNMKTDEENVRISTGINAQIWARSIQHPPRRIKVKMLKEEEDGSEVVKVMLLDETWKVVKINYPEEAEKKPEKKEEKKEEKPAEKPGAQKAEKKPEKKEEKESPKPEKAKEVK